MGPPNKPNFGRSGLGPLGRGGDIVSSNFPYIFSTTQQPTVPSLPTTPPTPIAPTALVVPVVPVVPTALPAFNVPTRPRRR